MVGLGLARSMAWLLLAGSVFMGSSAAHAEQRK